MQPIVSIIIPTYNRAHLIGETLDSVLAQTYENWECVVVDDGSIDATDELLGFYCERDSRIQYHHRPKDLFKGANACRNYGFELSKGEYIQWFDSDDVMHPYKLVDQVKSIEASSVTLSVCQAQIFTSSFKMPSVLPPKEINSINPFTDYLQNKIFWMTPSILWKRNFLLGLDGLYDVNLKAAQEWEFHTRLLSKSPDYIIVDRSLVYIRDHEENITKDFDVQNIQWNYFLARMKIYKKLRPFLNNEEKQYLLAYFFNNYKLSLRTNRMKLATRILVKYILKDRDLSLLTKLRFTLAFFSFGFFEKGNVFLKELNPPKI